MPMNQTQLTLQFNATLWSIWCRQNDVLFRHVLVNPVTILKLIDENRREDIRVSMACYSPPFHLM